ncbi:hypothetical protein HY637_00380 [Candidatus Woesearchaeota archaeon]|nr:hypothetical protein [Candidatus Woesearchaeota archaeon]
MRVFSNSKSQAALEFLTTYGWAFLVILIMVGTLAYFGILSPSKILPNRCTFGSEISCIDHRLQAGVVNLKIKSNVGEPIEVQSVKLTKDDGALFGGCCDEATQTCTPSSGTLTAWKSGETRDLTFGGSTACTGTALIAGNKGKVLVTIKYYATASSSTYSKEIQGEIYSTVQ